MEQSDVPVAFFLLYIKEYINLDAEVFFILIALLYFYGMIVQR
ncbi:hypothetical protein B4166_3189 [Caldibacillus thermoamylovorans]|uniref:Uncharacterized protein n=1 Tax=Caldibacillus thermoamylovorans TaxID=35841 RepID=A0ABD4A4S5_9BACI|nr:hypothetical protein B4166_3189 [Caldibacillus thermoamylovorans]KIO71699.1 hypothetical protein B4167_3331 [Caldibacillus thermoamylovorans]